MKIVKQSGEIVDFDPEKLKSSLIHSGADIYVVDKIVEIISNEVFQGSTTHQIYKRAFGLLKKSAHASAARYNLKEAINKLGPAGFFFEKYVSKLFESAQYEAKTNITLKGQSVSHEIDVIAKKDGRINMVECKFHAGVNGKCDVKISMYILSRYNDLKDLDYFLFEENEYISSCWIVTNSKFTLDAIAFAEFYGLKLLSWDYPPEDNIKTKIAHDSLYPITCLTSLSVSEKDKLLVSDIILVKELYNNYTILEKIGISPNRIRTVLKEVSELCDQA